MGTEVGWTRSRSLLEIINSERMKKEQIVTEGNGFVPATLGDLRTRDLLGLSCSKTNGSDKELDLDLQPVPSGWEKRLDMKSGKIYLHNCGTSTADHGRINSIQDLDFPPYSHAINDSKEPKTPRNNSNFSESLWLSRLLADRNLEASRPLEEHNFIGSSTAQGDLKGNEGERDSNAGDQGLELKLSSDLRCFEWQSVCTLDKVKMALKRAEKETGKRKVSDLSDSKPRGGLLNLQAPSGSTQRSRDRSPSSSSCSSLGLSLQERTGTKLGCDGSEVENKSSSLLAAACPRCLFYVLLPKTNPKCPRCRYSILTDNISSPLHKRARSTGVFDMEEESSGGGLGETRSSDHTLFDLNTVSY